MKILQGGMLSDFGAKTVTVPAWAERYNSGKILTPAASRYMQSPTANTCVTMKAVALSQIPWQVVIPGKEENKPVGDDNPMWTMLDEVNPDMNWIDLVSATSRDMDIFGAAYWLKLDRAYLLRLNPASMKIVTDGSGITHFEQRASVRSTPQRFLREEIVYFHEYHPLDDLEGLAPVEVCRAAIEQEIAAAQYVSAFFENYAVPALLFETSQTADIGKFIAWWKKLFQGAKNQHKTGVMVPGMKPHEIGTKNLRDLALEQVKAEARRDICAVLGVPPALAGAWEAANYATAREQHRSFYEDTIFPRAAYMAGVINAELAPDFGNFKFEWIYDELPIMQPDRLMEAQRVAILVNAGVITPQIGAVEAGFQEEDAPEQRPEPVQETQRSAMGQDLDKWQRKAQNRLSNGKGAQVDFESDAIPAAVSSYIVGALGTCKTKADVAGVFELFE